MTDPLEQFKAAHRDLDPRPMPDLADVIGRGRRTQRRHRLVGAGVATATALALVAGGNLVSHWARPGEGNVVGPAGGTTTASFEPSTQRIVGPANILASDWPQGYTPPEEPVYADAAAEEPRPETWPADTQFFTVAAGQLPVAQSGPLKGAVNTEVTFAILPGTPGTRHAFFLDGDRNARQFTSGDKLTAGQMASVRAMALYAISGIPLGKARDLVAWTFPRHGAFDTTAYCPATTIEDTRQPGKTTSSHQYCDELFTAHPNIWLTPTTTDRDAKFAALRDTYVPCLRRAGIEVTVPPDAATWSTAAGADGAAGTWPFTTHRSESANEEPYASCMPAPQSFIRLLQGAQNPPGVKG